MTYDLILLDIETQRDLFLPSGSCYTPQAAEARKNIYKLLDWARTNGQPIISTVLRLPRGHIGPLADVPHCIEDTAGERKLSKTLLNNYHNLGMSNNTDLPPDVFSRHQQVIIEKRHTDIFKHGRAERLVTESNGNTGFVVCGGAVHAGVVEAAVGLRSRGFTVIVPRDAVVTLDDPRAEYAVQRMDAKGVLMTRTHDVVTQPKPKRGQRERLRELMEAGA
ncbi:MAG: isochorismatase family protein [Planctomycetes bacterium]|jgi:nicotinamidase-related amidase|nr:isochorismatase family protein [Planctomycetota bacterium]